MDVDEVAEDQLVQDSARSLSATPLTARFGQRSYESHCPSSSTKQTCEIPDFLGVPDAIEASTLVQESGGDRIAWHDLEMQLMQATLEDKKMSELILERAVQRHNQTRSRMHQRKVLGSWTSLGFLIFGVVPASLFVFYLAHMVSNINLEHPV
jgi:hypothetical protein